MRSLILTLLIAVFLLGCTPPPAAPVPSIDAACAEVDHVWGNWPATIDVLERLNEQGLSCWAEPISSKLYAAHFNYGLELESAGEFDEAVTHFRAALVLDGQRDEALKALARLNALPDPTPAPCLAEAAPNSDPASPIEPDPAQIVRVDGAHLTLNNEPFTIRGVNYYPRHAPWHRFIPEMNIAEVEKELVLLREAGFNTLRLFLWYEPLFTCAPEDAIPNEAAFAKFDALLDLAAEHDLKAMITLNDLPDLYFRPLYTDWARYDAQTTYIVRRYRHHAAVMGWDLRNEGDLDYGARGDPSRFTQEQVIGWLAHLSEIVRANDPHHLITAGWWGDPAATEPYVDVLSFHHWTSAGELDTRIASYQTQAKPLLLQEVGYHSWEAGGQNANRQAELLGAAVRSAEANNLAGWMVWTAFDYAPMPGQPPNFEHHFGLWTLDLQPKPALDAIRP